MNEQGFPGLVDHGWLETAAQAMKCGEEASGGQQTGKERGRQRQTEVEVGRGNRRWKTLNLFPAILFTFLID